MLVTGWTLFISCFVRLTDAHDACFPEMQATQNSCVGLFAVCMLSVETGLPLFVLKINLRLPRGEDRSHVGRLEFALPIHLRLLDLFLSLLFLLEFLLKNFIIALRDLNLFLQSHIGLQGAICVGWRRRNGITWKGHTSQLINTHPCQRDIWR